LSLENLLLKTEKINGEVAKKLKSDQQSIQTASKIVERLAIKKDET
jgi:hypothetical protein